jgi:MFS family permease
MSLLGWTGPRPESRVNYGGLFISLGFLIVGAGLQTVLISLTGRQEGLSPQTLGWIGSAYFLGYLTGSRTGVKIILNVGHIRAFAALAGLFTAAALSFMLWVHPVFWMFLRFISGFCLAGLYVAVESWVNRAAESGKRGAAIAYYRRVDLSASILAQTLLIALPFHPSSLFSMLCIFLALSIVPISIIKVSPPSLEAVDTSVNFRAALALTPVGLVGVFIFGMINAMIWVLGPIFILTVQGSSERFVSLFLVLFLLGGTLAEGPVGRLSDKRDRRVIILILATLASMTSLLIFFMGVYSIKALMVGAFLFGVTWIPLYSICIALAHDQSDPKLFLSISSALILSYAVGASLGPVMGGAVMGIWGQAVLFGFIAILLIGVAAYGLYRIWVRRPVPEEERAEFVAVPSQAAELIFELDPRLDEVRKTDGE